MENTKGIDFELIVVNNGSKDGTKKGLTEEAKKYSNLKVITSKTNLGFGGGNNLGYKQALGKYICFISNDVVTSNPDWLFKFVEAIKETPKALFGPHLVDFNNLTLFRSQITPYITGHTMFGSKEMFDEIKEGSQIFDEGFGTAYFEDVELSVRAVNAGYELKELIGLGLNHLGSKSSDQIDIGGQTKEAQDYFTNKMTLLWLSKIKKKRIVFYFKCPYPFNDSSYEGKGVGGAEASLILLAREFAKAGWQTEVYNTTDLAGTFNGVEYHYIKEFKPTDHMDTFVLFRTPERFIRYVNAENKIFWSCDQYTVGNWQTEVFPFIDKIIAISDYHASYMNMVYAPPKDKLHVIELGINELDYKEPLQKVPGKLIYCSVPGRGLEHLKSLFLEIKKQVPYATLYITSDYRLWGVEEPNNEGFINLFANTEGVNFLGKISRKELVYHQKTSEVMAYPCTYEECFCISAMECIAAGAIPVTTSLAALKTTVSDSGILLSNFPGQGNYDNNFISSVVELLKNQKRAETLRKSGIQRALTKYSWKSVYEKWNEILEKGGKNMAKPVCPTCGKSMPNNYVLSKHLQKSHGEEGVVETSTGFKQVLKFTQFVEAQVNGRKYAAERKEDCYEVVVDSEDVTAFLEVVQTAYGKGVLLA